MIDPTARLHAQAIVDGDCDIGARSAVWQFASVLRGARLGEDCSVAPGAMLDGCAFGNRCRIGPNVAMGPGFVFGDDCFIGPGVVVCNDMWPRADKEGWSAELLRGGFVTVRAGNGVSIGANAVILPGVTLGAGCVVAAGAVVTRSVGEQLLWRRDGRVWVLPETMRRMREC